MEKETQKTIISIGGMHCVSCASNVEKQLTALLGVVDAKVNFASGRALVIFEPKIVDIEKLYQAVESAGYKPLSAVAFGSLATRDRSAQGSLKIRFLISLLFSVPLMYISMSGTFNLPLPQAILNHCALVQWILATVVIILGLSFFSSGVLAFFRTRRANMDTLICLGVSLAYLYSLFLSLSVWKAGVTFYHQHLYYETAAFIVTFILLGKYLEAAATGRTSLALYKLMNLAPKKSYVLRNGAECEILADEVMIGDIVIVKPGGRIAADGIVIEGYSSVDEAMVTGEMLPVEKSPGKQVIAGTVNKTG